MQKHLIINTMENLGVSYNILQLKANRENNIDNIEQVAKQLFYKVFTIYHTQTKANEVYLVKPNKQKVIVNCLINYIIRTKSNDMNQISYFKGI